MIKIKHAYTWATEHFVLFINDAYAGSFENHAEALRYGLKLTSSMLLLENK